MAVGNYQCLDLATARAQIESVGLVVGTVLPGSGPEFDPWLVIAQLPTPGSEVAPGDPVNLVVGDPADPCPPV